MTSSPRLTSPVPSQPVVWHRPHVYFAGKISRHDWRFNLVPNLKGAEFGIPISQDRFIYVGPFFIAFEHGCTHGPGTHGVNEYICTNYTPPRWTVPALCQIWIRQANLLFAWINEGSAYGTLTEIGWAQLMKIPVYIGFANWSLAEEMWFAAGGPRTWSGIHSNPASALEAALALCQGL